MTILEETPVVVAQPKREPPPMFHRLCCLEHSKTICGIPRKQTKVDRHDVIKSTDCIVCDDLWDTTKHCPAGLACLNPDRGKKIFS